MSDPKKALPEGVIVTVKEAGTREVVTTEHYVVINFQTGDESGRIVEVIGASSYGSGARGAYEDAIKKALELTTDADDA